MWLEEEATLYFGRQQYGGMLLVTNAYEGTIWGKGERFHMHTQLLS